MGARHSKHVVRYQRKKIKIAQNSFEEVGRDSECENFETVATISSPSDDKTIKNYSKTNTFCIRQNTEANLEDGSEEEEFLGNNDQTNYFAKRHCLQTLPVVFKGESVNMSNWIK